MGSAMETGVVENRTVRSGLIPRSSRIGELVEWTMGARSDDETRYFLGGVHVEPVEPGNDGWRYILATDGRRLHRAIIDRGAIPDGDYTATIVKGDILLTEREDIIFPNWRRVVGDYTLEVCDYRAFPWKKGDHGTSPRKHGLGGSTSVGVCALVRATGCTFNLQYLFDLSSPHKMALQFKVRMADERPTNKGVEFVIADDRYAIIMPMLLE